MKLHDIIKNVYEKCLKPIFSIEVLGEDNKWKNIVSLNITQKNTFYKIKTKTYSLLCTKNHILIDENNNEILAIDSLNKNIQTKTGIENVISIEKTNIIDNAYDLTLSNSSNHLYFCNNLLSHNCVICDEFAFLQNRLADKLFTSMYPVISSSKNGKFIIVSTPNGMDNLYYDIWTQANSKDAKKNLDGWKPFTMYWWQVPGHDEAWKERQIAAIGETRFAQEFNNEFLSDTSTLKLIPSDIIDKYKMQLSEMRAQQKEFLSGKTTRIISEDQRKMYEFTMWHEFNIERTYAASGDVAEGNGGDSSVLYVWDITDTSEIKMCAKFSSDKVSLNEFAYITSKILSLYGKPYYICERNGIGSGYLDILNITYGYDKIVSEAKNNAIGVFSHISIKSKACLWARDMMTTQGFGFKLYDKELIDDMTTFIKKQSKGNYISYAAIPGQHDDHIMALIWLCYLLQNDIIERYYVVVETFTSSLNNIYAKTIMPQKQYTTEEVKSAIEDPAYQDFLDFKENLIHKFNSLKMDEKKDDQLYKWSNERDIYFGDSIFEPSWNHNIPINSNAQMLNPNNKPAAFFIL